jgi:hypothetical protein
MVAAAWPTVTVTSPETVKNVSLSGASSAKELTPKKANGSSSRGMNVRIGITFFGHPGMDLSLQYQHISDLIFPLCAEFKILSYI